MSMRHLIEPDALDPDTATARPVVPGTHFRQGDVLLLAIDPDGLPEKVRTVPRQGGRVVLAEGEATGHAHAIRSPGAALLQANDERYLRVTAPVTLDHEEHAALDFPPGTYRVVIQREYVPPEVSSVAFRRVVD